MWRVTSLHQFSLSDQLEQIRSYCNKPQKFNHEVSEHILYSLYNSILGVLQQGKYICAVLPKLSGIMVPLQNKIVFYLDVNSLIIVNIGSQSLITGKAIDIKCPIVC